MFVIIITFFSLLGYQNFVQKIIPELNKKKKTVRDWLKSASAAFASQGQQSELWEDHQLGPCGCVRRYVRCCSILTKCGYCQAVRWVRSTSGEPSSLVWFVFGGCHLVIGIGWHQSVISLKTVARQQKNLYFNTISEKLLAATCEKVISAQVSVGLLT